MQAERARTLATRFSSSVISDLLDMEYTTPPLVPWSLVPLPDFLADADRLLVLTPSNPPSNRTSCNDNQSNNQFIQQQRACAVEMIPRCWVVSCISDVIPRYNNHTLCPTHNGSHLCILGPLYRMAQLVLRQLHGDRVLMWEGFGSTNN